MADPLLDKQILIQLGQKVLPQAQLQNAWRLSGGISAEEMLALELIQSDGQQHRVVVRAQATPEAVQNEYQLLHIMQSAGLKTPVPYLLDLSCSLLPHPYLILEFMAGTITFWPANLLDYLHQLATQLAHIHRLDVSRRDLSFLPEVNCACVELERKRPSSPLFLQEERIYQVLSAWNATEYAHKNVLLHGDFWPGNSLWQEGQLTAVIDWEDAQVGDPLIDLAQSRSEIAWIFGPEAMIAFTAYYQKQMVLDYRHLPYRDLCAALRQIRILGADLADFTDYFVGYGRTDITPQTIQYNLNLFINSALAQLNP